MAPLLPLLIAFALSTALLASPHGSRNLYAHPHRALARSPVDVHADAPSLPLSPPRKRSLNKRCIPRPSNATTTTPTPTPTPSPSTPAPENVAGAPSSPPYSSPTPPAYKPTSSAPTSSSPASPPAQTGSSSGSSGGSSGFLSGLQYGSATWYDTGLGSCGQTDTNTDFIVAVSELLYDVYPGYGNANPNTNPVCGRKVQIYYLTASITATVVDRCTGCKNQTSLDLSPSAFSALASQALGIIPITWQWVN